MVSGVSRTQVSVVSCPPSFLYLIGHIQLTEYQLYGRPCSPSIQSCGMSFLQPSIPCNPFLLFTLSLQHLLIFASPHLFQNASFMRAEASSVLFTAISPVPRMVPGTQQMLNKELLNKRTKEILVKTGHLILLVSIMPRTCFAFS